MNDAAIRQAVDGFIAERFLASAGLDSIRPEDSFLENGILDSTGVLELVHFLEERFGIRVADEELVPDNLDSIDRVVAYLRRKGAASAAG